MTSFCSSPYWVCFIRSERIVWLTNENELQHIKTAIQACQFPNWALNQWHHKFFNKNNPANNNSQNNNNNNNQDNNPNKRTITLVVPFIPDSSKKFKKLCKVKGIQVHYTGTNTLRTMLGKPQGQGPQIQQKWSYIPLYMPSHQLPRCIHRRIRQGIGRSCQRTS